MKTQMFHHPKILPSRNPLKETKFLQDTYYNFIIINLNFQHKPKYIIFHIKILI
jgi:hypothetical protein